MINNDLTPQILRRAYEIWEHEGRPHGRDKAHWFLAEAEVTTNGASVVEPIKPKRKPRSALSLTKTKKR
jgi:hypothetical protein